MGEVHGQIAAATYLAYITLVVCSSEVKQNTCQWARQLLPCKGLQLLCIDAKVASLSGPTPLQTRASYIAGWDPKLMSALSTRWDL